MITPEGGLAKHQENPRPRALERKSRKKKKPEWANFAANKIREAPVGADDIWAFVRKMAEYQRDEINRIAGYAL